MTDRVIYLRKRGSEYRVTVEPTNPADDWDQSFPTYKEARPWARGCRLARGWPLIDETGGGA